MQETWVEKIPWKGEKLPTPIFRPGEFHGLYNPWGCKESDKTEWLSLTHSRFPYIFYDGCFKLIHINCYLWVSFFDGIKAFFSIVYSSCFHLKKKKKKFNWNQQKPREISLGAAMLSPIFLSWAWVCSICVIISSKPSGWSMTLHSALHLAHFSCSIYY